MSYRRIGILTSGGDCAGLNAVVRAFTHALSAIADCEVFGILDGTLGLMDAPVRVRRLHIGDDFDDRLLRSGGTQLGSISRGDPWRFPMPDGSWRDRRDDFSRGVRELGLEALAVIGGDGSMRIVAGLCAHAGLPMIGIPKTIDNDVRGTESTVGFATAVSVVSEALDRLQSTAASHHRVIVVETMGREAGHIALHGGIAGGADVILVPELGFERQAVQAQVEAAFRRNRRHALVVVAEGVGGTHRSEIGVGQLIARNIEADVGVEARCTVLGHLQRGGSPVAVDRILASEMGVHAAQLIASRAHERVVVQQAGAIRDIDLGIATAGSRRMSLADPLLNVARQLGIGLG